MVFNRLFQNAGLIWAKTRTGIRHEQGSLATLTQLLRSAQRTRYGQKHGFAEILASRDLYSAFCKQVPLIDYQGWVDFLPISPHDKVVPLIDQAWPGEINVFCLSSGTTSGRTKYIPYSKAMTQVNRQAALDMFAHMVHAAPDITPPVGRSFYMTGSTNITTNEQGCLCGDMSGITRYLAPKMLDAITLPPRSIASLEPWEKRLEAMVDMCQSRRDISAIFGIPIWQLTLLEALEAATGKRPAEIMPGLRYIVHGGMSMAPYRERVKELVGDRVQLIEIYAASETGITAFSLPGEKGMRFWENYRVFYEFEDDEGQICLSQDIQVGKPYKLIVSSCSGLWRYRIGDVVVFRQKSPLILDYVTRDKTTSAFDEKVTEKELELALARMTPTFADFSVGPDIKERRHVWFLMGDAVPSEDWVAALDQHLRAQNQDYDDYRGDGRIAHPVAVPIASRGEFLTAMGRSEGGQRKFPRLLGPDEVTLALERFDS